MQVFAACRASGHQVDGILCNNMQRVMGLRFVALSTNVIAALSTRVSKHGAFRTSMPGREWWHFWTNAVYLASCVVMSGSAKQSLDWTLQERQRNLHVNAGPLPVHRHHITLP